MWDRVVHAITAARGYQTRMLAPLKDQTNVQLQMVASIAHGLRAVVSGRSEVHWNQAQSSGADQVREQLGQPQAASGSSSLMRFVTLGGWLVGLAP